MKRITAMYSICPGCTPDLSGMQENCEKFGARNASAWTVEGYVYLYAEFEDDNPRGLNDLIPENARRALVEIAAPGSMELMYHDIGVVREDKSRIRRRVFATVLKPGCAREYKARHQKLIDARGDRVSDGPETNFTIRCACDKYIFGYCELVKSYDHPMTEEEKASTVAWETRQLEIMDWLTDDVDWITGEKHAKMRCLFLQAGY